MMAPLHAGSPNRSSCRTFVLVICRIGDFPQNGVQCANFLWKMMMKPHMLRKFSHHFSGKKILRCIA